MGSHDYLQEYLNTQAANSFTSNNAIRFIVIQSV